MLKMLYADKEGNILETNVWPAAANASGLVLLNINDLQPMPEGTELVFLPDRLAMGAGKSIIDSIGDGKYAVAAILPVGYTRTLLPAAKALDKTPHLPLKAYTAVAVKDGKICVAAVKSTESDKWNQCHYDTKDLQSKVDRLLRNFPNNRILQVLSNCASNWHCCNAQNMFYGRWEAGIPVSPQCNADCIGCISLQPAECCPSPQNRIDFVPTVKEVQEIAVYHLKKAREGIISFGQGCEGEPSLQDAVIVDAVRAIRSATEKGVININTNAGYSDGIMKIVDAGINSMRVSIISPTENIYKRYYRAVYSLENVKASIKYAKQKGVYVSLNMLIYPGLNDSATECEAWCDFIKDYEIDAIQLRNLNIDMKVMESFMSKEEWQMLGLPLGIKNFIKNLRKARPEIKIGSFTEI